MAYVLSLQPHTPLKRSFTDNPYLIPCSPRDTFLGQFSDLATRTTSACSLYSLGSNRTGDWGCRNENTPPLTSQSLHDFVIDNDGSTSSIITLPDEPRKRHRHGGQPSSFVFPAPVPTPLWPTNLHQEQQSTRPPSKMPSPSDTMDIDSDQHKDLASFDLYKTISIPVPNVGPSQRKSNQLLRDEVAKFDNCTASSQPFQRWLSTLRRRRAQHHKEPLSEGMRPSLDRDGVSAMLPLPKRVLGSISNASESMSSSMDGITATKSVSITIGSLSIAPNSHLGVHSKVRLGNRSINNSGNRMSLESYHGALGCIVDESAWLRSLQRRRVVEELVSSEESYIADLKVLINDYFMILTALPAAPGQAKSSIQQNISQILQLHEDLLAELHQAIPQADFTKSAHVETYPVTKAKHIRFHSADILPGRLAEHKAARRIRHSLEIGRSPDRKLRGLVTDTKTVERVAKIFNKHMKRFFTYEEYGAHWTTMSQDITTMCKGLHGWQEYERGVEALQKIVASENNRDAGSKKALTFPDLLIKPIQRVCKYPLLFDDLCRHTPVYDDPEAHAELEKALFRFQETIREVNKAKDDPNTRRLIEITWQLQDRLDFEEQKVSRALVFRLLGHVLLCGVLHVAYQTPERVKGQYMICVMYRSCLVLATANRFHSPYTVVASIALANGNIEEPENGRGLQCYNAPHTWKLVFEHGHRLHEIILSACTVQEESIWKEQLRERIVHETHDFVEGQSTMQDIFSSLSLDIKSLGPVFGHANSLVRRMSVHRAATLGAKSATSQVIIKNTQAQKAPQPPPTFSPSMLARSQSHMSSNNVPVLAPRRADRIRLETALEDVWTKDILPFPGMASRRENQIRASANSVMRKLSMASIASNFSRRSPSFSSASNPRSEDSFGSRVHKMSHGNLRPRSATDRRTTPTVVDFHTAPAAFLPTDFELEDTRPSSRRRRLANRTAGSDLSGEKVVYSKPTRVRRLSTHLINLPRSDSSLCVIDRKSSHGSHATVLRLPSPSVDFSAGGDIDKRKRNEETDKTTKGALSGKLSSSKYHKSRSRMFKFWV